MASGLSGQGSRDVLQLAAFVEAQGEPVLGKTLDGTIRSWNAGAERLAPPVRVGEIGKILARVGAAR